MQPAAQSTQPAAQSMQPAAPKFMPRNKDKSDEKAQNVYGNFAERCENRSKELMYDVFQIHTSWLPALKRKSPNVSRIVHPPVENVN